MVEQNKHANQLLLNKTKQNHYYFLHFLNCNNAQKWVFAHEVVVFRGSYYSDMYDPRLTNRQEKSLRHVAMVANFLDDNKLIKSLKSLFALFQTLPILFNFILFGKSWRHFLLGSCLLLSKFKKESDNLCVVFTYSIKRAREIRKFHVVVVQRRLRNLQNSVIQVQSCCLII